MAPAAKTRRRPDGNDGSERSGVRGRILEAAFAAFKTNGYGKTSTLDIATRARVSKRELYALVGNKQQMLIAAISERARRLEAPSDLLVPHDREALAQVLTAFGTRTVREVTDPAVISVFRLAIAEAVHAPEVARALDSIGRETSRAALRHIMEQAQTSGLLTGSAVELADQFRALLWGDLMVNLLLGVARRPNPHEIAGRARVATAAFLQLHPLPRLHARQ